MRFAATSPRPDPTFAHRTGTARVRVTGEGGAPLANAEVVVQQRDHAFGFGCIGFEFVPLAAGEDIPANEHEGSGLSRGALEDLAGKWFDLFNFATLPFYWGGFEPVRGAPRTDPLRAAARFLADRGVRVKGHPLVWHTLTAPWLRDLPVDEIERAQRERIRRDVAGFAGLVDTWDAINEGGDHAGVRQGGQRHHPAGPRGRAHRDDPPGVRGGPRRNPDATLILNDFDMSTAYDCLLEGALEAGIAIDVLGLQSHMHQGYWGEEKTMRILERFSRYGLPIHFTESTLLSGELMPADIVDLNDHQVPHWPSTPEGEERQADEIVRHYRTLLAHPSVEAITYWGLTDAGSWLGAPGGLVRADGTSKPAYHALRGLVREQWWLAPTTAVTDGDGVVTVGGWFGRYELAARGRTAEFDLNPGEQAVTVTL